MCGFGNPLSFKNVTDSHISNVECFIREKTLSILQKNANDSIDGDCEVLIDDETLNDHFGIYGNDICNFKFEEGDIILIKEYVKHVKQVADGNGINKGLGHFFNSNVLRGRPKKLKISQTKNFNPIIRTEIAINEEKLQSELDEKLLFVFSLLRSNLIQNLFPLQ